MTHSELVARVQRMEDEAAIRNLVVKYAICIDDRNYAALAELFAEDAVLTRADGSRTSRGRAAIIDGFRNRLSTVGFSRHAVHGHVVELPTDSDVGTGIVSGHAETWSDGRLMLAAMRYVDRYRRSLNGWTFQSRVMHYGYFIDAANYPAALGDPKSVQNGDNLRMRDFPPTDQ